MTSTAIRRATVAGLLTVGMTLAGTGTATAGTYTKQFTGEGSSSFGFAWMYARWDARSQAVADGFSDPDHQCVETWSFGDIYWAKVVWTCTRPV
ncbi:hypothetical protein [Actinocrispum wychmicini]|uniref:Secreted protein n=1 Tax=Actinocrispum wychmicini TaxID=1213861 RepID=A0A4R2J4T2_9PSEU|nr:hypothetical protein [Actinocrispum wychmicini]TCO52282.1 hypothetical protein EV192_11213 [Actinocrispum wychmicini]